MGELPTPVENEYLASMLAWERGPLVLPIGEWFDPPLVLPRPDTLSDEQLHDVLWDTIQRLYDKRVVLDFTDHLSDRQLYCLIYRDILPSPEKKLERSDNYSALGLRRCRRRSLRLAARLRQRGRPPQLDRD